MAAVQTGQSRSDRWDSVTGDVHNRGLGQGVTMLKSPPHQFPQLVLWSDGSAGLSSHLQHELPARKHPSANNQDQELPSAPLPQTVIKQETHKGH